MGRQTNWNRPSFKIRGRETESLNGADIPTAAHTPRKPQQSKSDMRDEAKRAVEEFERKKITGRKI